MRQVAIGPDNFHHGGSLAVYGARTHQWIGVLADEIGLTAVGEVWDTALATSWQVPPVWMHGDIAENNLLVKEGRLNAVIDFGSSAVGDPCCDLVIAWTLFDPAGREKFRSAIALDPASWKRARGWAIWKALITLAQRRHADPIKAKKARQIIRDILDNHSRAAQNE